MSEFNNKYNYHDSKIRNIIIAVLNVFKDKIGFKQYTESNKYDIHKIPFYYSLTGAQDFLLDHFMTSDYSALSEQEINNNYEPVPRGVITLTSLEIDSGALINRHIRTQIPIKVDATIYKMYSYETMIIPINMTFDVRMTCNSNLEMFKIIESLITNFYKTNNFYVDFDGFYARGTIDLPESYDRNQLFEFGFVDKTTYEITFSIEVKTSFPVFDEKSEMFMGNKMESFTSNIFGIQVYPEKGMYSNLPGGIISGKDGMKYNDSEIK